MEYLFGAYIRVQRGLDSANGLLDTSQAFENNPSCMNSEDRIRLLDLTPRSA
ncbi:hypothetical protein BDV36DRAFT_262879 [Aspergillus pseudocaelatus]|uniref:Uncharacterized protein n=1 Tax=Aspergillus pseudocaelatus TaxID=1825620 RepID=A0ABQ6WIW8_9EURO|nr:hypothetical protein BDV36DRAFT_262879 [Aspergillus pseudocaelatus]